MSIVVTAEIHSGIIVALAWHCAIGVDYSATVGSWTTALVVPSVTLNGLNWTCL